LEQTTLSDIQFQKGKSSLGKGAYGEVEMATHKRLGIKLAIKKIDKRSLVNKKIRATLLREVDIHKRLKHENIIRLYASCEDAETIYLVLEYAEMGNLFFFIRKQKRRLSEEEAFHYFIQTCSGIYFLHKHGLLHRDIKPENLLLSCTSPDQ
jgi:serine/threonine protein kinase